MKIILIGLGLLPELVVAALFIAAAVTPRPGPLGAVDGKLAECPEPPNCVSTQATDRLHRIAPIPYRGTQAEASTQLLGVVVDGLGMKVISNQPPYLALEARSAFFRFVDDVDFYFDDRAKLIHFRSSSRIGQGDMGVNRTRMEQVRQQFAAANR